MVDRRNLKLEAEQAVDAVHRRAHGILHREYHVFRYLDVLAQQRIVLCTARYHGRAVGKVAPRELAGDVRHHHRDHRRTAAHFVENILEPQVVHQFGEDFLAGGLSHRLVDVVAIFVDEQPVSPEREHALGLAGEVRRMRHHDGHQPPRVLERHQTPGAGRVARECLDPLHQHRRAHRQRERLPLAFVDVAAERRRTAKTRYLAFHRLPKRPGTVRLVAHELRWVIVVAAARVGRHRTDRDEYIVVRADHVGNVLAVARAMDLFDPVPVVLDEVDVGHFGVVIKLHALADQPFLYRNHDRLVLIQCASPHARERVYSRELLQEPQHVALELDRTVPVLKCEGGAPHRPEVGGEKVR